MLIILFLGDKSEVLNIEEPDYTKFPSFKDVTHHKGLLEEGDILFIPGKRYFQNIYTKQKTILCAYRVNILKF